MRSETCIKDSNLGIFNVLTGNATLIEEEDEYDGSQYSTYSDARGGLLDPEFEQNRDANISEDVFDQIKREEQLKKVREANKRNQMNQAI